MAYEKPLPDITAEDRPFWEAAKAHRFVLPKCRSCGNVWYPAYRSCPRCLSFEVDFIPASGRGTVWGCTIMRQPYVPGYRDELPYNVVLVELEEGPIVCSNMVGLPLEKIHPGIRVEAIFDDVTPEITLIRFRAASA